MGKRDRKGRTIKASEIPASGVPKGASVILDDEQEPPPPEPELESPGRDDGGSL